MTNEYMKSILDSNNPADVTVYLVNGIKLEGELIDFDDLTIQMTSEKGQPNQLVFRQAISTIKPKRSQNH